MDATHLRRAASMTSPLPASFSPALVRLDLNASSEEDGIRAVTALLNGQPDVADAAALAEEVIEREKLCSTALGHGVAFTHARTTGVRHLVVAVGYSREGVPFVDAGETVNFLFVIGTPPDRVPPYLALVGYLARTLKSEPVRAKLAKAVDAAEFLAVLRTGG